MAHLADGLSLSHLCRRSAMRSLDSPRLLPSFSGWTTTDDTPWLTATTVNGVELLFFKQESRPGNTPIVTFEIAEGGIDDMISELAGKSVTIVTPVSHAPGGWSAEISDPEGHVLSMYQSAEKPRKR